MRTLLDPIDPVKTHPLESPGFRSRLPGAVTAFDPPEMREALQGAFLGEGTAYRIEACKVLKAIYLPLEGRCNLVYRVELRHIDSATPTTRVVCARLFSSRDACQLYLRERLAPLGRLMRTRPEIAPFATPVASLESLTMLASVFPVDGDLPALVGATHPASMGDLLGKVFPRTANGESSPACRVELVRYPARKRCVLRYQVEGQLDTEQTDPWMVYGKVHQHAPDHLAASAMLALGELARRGAGGYAFHVPRPISHAGAPELSLLEAIPGQTRTLRRLLKKRARGLADRPGRVTLEGMLDVCAHVAAVLHASRIPLGRRKTARTDLRRLRAGLAGVEPFAPALARRLVRGCDQLERHFQRSQPLGLCFSHGDFNHSQFLFDGGVGGLVDFDSLCQAEPAHDLGRFLAYLRVAVRRVDGTTPACFTEALRDRFLCAYHSALQDPRVPLGPLRTRVALYEATTLLDLAMRSWLKFKKRRLTQATEILDSLEILAAG